MELQEAKQKFIDSWGTLGSQWGINKTMSQIHALLLVSTRALSTEEIMEALQISRGNTNMNVRALMDWGLVQKEFKPGERKEFFKAGKDMWETARKITAERKKREIDPILQTLDELAKVNLTDEESEEAKAFKSSIDNLQKFTSKANGLVNTFIRSDENWFYKTLMKLVK